MALPQPSSRNTQGHPYAAQLFLPVPKARHGALGEFRHELLMVSLKLLCRPSLGRGVRPAIDEGCTNHP
jgi:hypothetical protein